MANRSLDVLSIATFEMMRVETYTNMAAASLLFYDCVLTVHEEATLIWPTHFNLVKALFFLTRYLAFVDVSLVLYYQLKPNISVQSCEKAYTAAGWFIAFGIILAETVLLVRTWAIWGRSKKLAVSLGVLFVVAVTPAVAIEAIFLKSIVFSPLSNPATPGCLVVAGNPIIAISFVIIIVYETLVLVLTLIKGIQHFRVAGSQGLLSVLYRDGILFYIYLLSISVTNLIVIVATPRGLATTLALIQRILHSCLTSRILINLRKASGSRESSSFSRNRSSIMVNESTGLRTFSPQSPSTIISYSSRTLLDGPLVKAEEREDGVGVGVGEAY